MVSGVHLTQGVKHPANFNGQHQDLGGRLNHLLLTFTDIPIQQFYGHDFPDVERLEFADGTELRARIIADKPSFGDAFSTIPESIIGFDKKMKKSFLKYFSTKPRKLPTNPRSFHDPNPEQKKITLNKPTSRISTPPANPCQLFMDIKIKGEKASIYDCEVKGEKAVLVVLPTFSDDSEKGYSVILESLKFANRNQVKKLIVDVSYNNGGFVGFGYVAMVGFTGRSPQEFRQFFTTRKTEGVQNYLTVRTPDNIFLRQINPVTGEMYTNEKYYNSGETTYPFAPNDVFVTPAFYFIRPQFIEKQPLIDYVYSVSNFTPEAIPDSPFDDIIILTDGLCHSTCSIFTTGIQDLKKKK